MLYYGIGKQLFSLVPFGSSTKPYNSPGIHTKLASGGGFFVGKNATNECRRKKSLALRVYLYAWESDGFCDYTSYGSFFTPNSKQQTEHKMGTGTWARGELWVFHPFPSRVGFYYFMINCLGWIKISFFICRERGVGCAWALNANSLFSFSLHMRIIFPLFTISLLKVA